MGHRATAPFALLFLSVFFIDTVLVITLLAKQGQEGQKENLVRVVLTQWISKLSVRQDYLGPPA